METHGLDALRVKQKTQKARDWRGEIELPMGDESVTVGFRLLTETEMTEMQQLLDTGEVDAYEDEQADTYERLMELQEKPREELSDEEQSELKELLAEVKSEQGDVEDQFGTEAVNRVLQLGRDVVKPSRADIETVWEMPPSKQEGVLGAVPESKDDIEDVLAAELQDSLANQPYPLKIRLGMKAMSESQQVWGNGLPTQS